MRATMSFKAGRNKLIETLTYRGRVMQQHRPSAVIRAHNPDREWCSLCTTSVSKRDWPRHAQTPFHRANARKLRNLEDMALAMWEEHRGAPIDEEAPVERQMETAFDDYTAMLHRREEAFNAMVHGTIDSGRSGGAGKTAADGKNRLEGADKEEQPRPPSAALVTNNTLPHHRPLRQTPETHRKSDVRDATRLIREEEALERSSRRHSAMSAHSSSPPRRRGDEYLLGPREEERRTGASPMPRRHAFSTAMDYEEEEHQLDTEEHFSSSRGGRDRFAAGDGREKYQARNEHRHSHHRGGERYSGQQQQQDGRRQRDVSSPRRLSPSYTPSANGSRGSESRHPPFHSTWQHAPRH